MDDVKRLLRSERASVIAPAGCGKTELIAKAVAQEHGPSLVLTHTHAGVSALRARLARYGVARDRARVETIAGWCLRFAAAYPGRSGLDTTQPTGPEWNAVYDGAARVLETQAVRRVVQASYASLFVDEYQDCCEEQHRVIKMLAGLLPCRVFGDPLQGIFAFAGRTLAWAQVESAFPHLTELRTPWRWKSRNDALGTWLLEARARLISGEAVDLQDAPLQWCEWSHENVGAAAYRLLRASGAAVVIRKWPNDSHGFARATRGNFRSMEEMDCKDLLTAASDLDHVSGVARAARLLRFAGDCMSGLATALPEVEDALKAGDLPSTTRRRKNVGAIEGLCRVARTDERSALLASMSLIERMDGVRIFRRELWGELRRTLTEVERGAHDSLRDAAWAVRNRARITGRKLDTRLVSRTVLIKGLEFDHALVPDADEFRDARRPGDGAKNLYVALTRGSVSLTVLSKSPLVRYPPAGL